MKVFVITPSLSHGGAERVASIWANGLQNLGHEVVVVTNLCDTIMYELTPVIKVLPLFSDKTNKYLKYICAVKRLRQYLKKERPNVIIGVMAVPSFMGLLASIGLRVPVVMTEHNSFERPKCAPMPVLDRITKFYINHFYSYITVLTRADLEVVKGRFKNISVLPNPLALTPLKNVPLKKNTILAVGRIDAWHYKGFDVLIKAWGTLMKNEEFRKKNPGWRLQIAGEGSNINFDFLKQLCITYGVDNYVDFLGFRKDVALLYQQASVFVLSSRYEAFGMVLIEAMSQGCACIACDYKGRQKDIITSEGEGLLCNTEDVEQLAIAMNKVISDKSLREKMQEGGIRRSLFYSPGNIVGKLNDILCAVAN